MDKYRHVIAAIILVWAECVFGQAFTFNDLAFITQSSTLLSCNSNDWVNIVPPMVNNFTPYGTLYGFTQGADPSDDAYKAFDRDAGTYYTMGALFGTTYVIWTVPTNHVVKAYSFYCWDVGNGDDYTNVCPTAWRLMASYDTNSNPIGTPQNWITLDLHTNTITYPLITNIYYVPTNRTAYPTHALCFDNSALGVFLFEAQFLGCQ